MHPAPPALRRSISTVSHFPAALHITAGRTANRVTFRLVGATMWVVVNAASQYGMPDRQAGRHGGGTLTKSTPASNSTSPRLFAWYDHANVRDSPAVHA